MLTKYRRTRNFRIYLFNSAREFKVCKFCNKKKIIHKKKLFSIYLCRGFTNTACVCRVASLRDDCLENYLEINCIKINIFPK